MGASRAFDEKKYTRSVELLLIAEEVINSLESEVEKQDLLFSQGDGNVIGDSLRYVFKLISTVISYCCNATEKYVAIRMLLGALFVLL